MTGYSLRNAFGWAAGGLGLTGAVTSGYAFWHHAQGHFETLSQSFAHLAQPANIAFAVVACAAFGAGIELANKYYKSLKNEQTPSFQPRSPQR